VTAALLDLNLLTALLWPTHEHHDVAHRWFSARGKAPWATCPLTQLGFVRLTSNPAFSRDALTPVQAIALLARNVAHPLHQFWPDSLSVEIATEPATPALRGHQQLTDAYLLGLARRRKGVLATFDRGMRSLAGETLASTLELIPARG
jgi:toxin-antitoxin system PIN domain toxin